MPRQRQYPHVDGVGDWQAAQSLRLLWDRIFDLEDQIQTLETDGTATAETLDALQSSLATTKRLAIQTRIGTGRAGSGTADGADGAGGGVDDGFGAQGCAVSGSDGHVPGGSPQTAVTAGQIVCGTAKETGAGWSGPALRAPVADLPTREANAEALLLRMIWHLQQAGFTAGRQRNPSGSISKDKLTVRIDGTFRAYDVFFGFDDFSTTMLTHMQQVFPASYVADAGTAD